MSRSTANRRNRFFTSDMVHGANDTNTAGLGQSEHVLYGAVAADAGCGPTLPCGLFDALRASAGCRG